MKRKVIAGIYQIKNLKNNKVYIGQSKNIYSRWTDHRAHLNVGTHDNDYLQKSWNKYGESCFEFTILEECENDFNILNELEVKWIQEKNALDRKFGYNIASGGGNSNPYENMDREKYLKHCDSISKRQKEYYKTHPSPFKGKTLPDDVKIYLSRINSDKNNPNYGKKRPEHSEKMSGANNPRAQKVMCIDTGEVFECAKDAAEKYNVTNSTILKTCKGKQKKSAGMSWKYA